MSTATDPFARVRSTGSWWRDAVVYQVYVRSFGDSDGDGEGDLAGITARIPYLAALGVDAVWLTPFYVSPMADGGYDVADYRDVDPTFGDLGAFDTLLHAAHKAGLRVIVDIVPNHSSDAHPWFVEALRAGPGSPERDRYVFRPGRGDDGDLPPNDWESIFGGPAWTRVADGEWYLHLFDPRQPDFNWRHPEVAAEFEAILRFWLDRGVDGFRVDVAHGMVKAAGLPDVGDTGHDGPQAAILGRSRLPYFDQDGVHDIYRTWRKILDSYPGERMAVAEAWAETPQRLARYVAPDELHQVFNFDFLRADWSAVSFRAVIDASLAEARQIGSPTTWVLSNHDKPRHVTRYGDGDRGLRRARAAALLMLALPGSAYLYQGEELGLPEVRDLPEELLQDPVWERSGRTDRGRDGCRVPLPWSGDTPPFGFGPPGSRAAWLPQPAEWAARTVAAQTGDPDSVLELYRSALRLRRELLATGLNTSASVRWLDSPPATLAFAREPGFVCAANFGEDAVELPTPTWYGRVACASGVVERSGDHVVLPPDTAAWFVTG